MTEGWDGLPPLTDDEVATLSRLGTCQARNRTSKRCKNRAEVQSDGSAYCEKHRLVKVD